MRFTEKFYGNGDILPEDSSKILIQNFILQNLNRTVSLYAAMCYRQTRQNLISMSKMNAYHIQEFGIYNTYMNYT